VGGYFYLKSNFLVVISIRMRQRGASLIEYSLLVSLVAILAIGAVRIVGAYATKPFCTITGAIVSEGSENTYLWVPDNSNGRPDCTTPEWGSSVWYNH
jgi:Flp pilus assembly pilin Flp